MRLWLVIFALSLAVAVSNSFGRFAYGLILPAMREDLGWTYAEAGWMNTANAIGYIIGAFAAMITVERIATRHLFAGGTLATALALVANGLTDDFAALTAWRILAGIGGAFVFIAGARIATDQFRDEPAKNSLSITIFYGGGGLGMVLSGATIPFLLDHSGPESWRLAWIAMGAASVVIALVTIPAGYRLGQGAAPATRGAITAVRTIRLRPIGFEIAGYMMFALGYIVYLTFLVAWMHELAFSPVLVAATWSAAGVGVIAAPFLWRPVLASSSSGLPLAASLACSGSATLLPLILPNAAGLIASAFLFGASVFTSPAAITVFTRRNLPQNVWGAGVALFTLLFAVTQVVSPVAVGALSDVTGSLDAGLAVAGGILLLGALLAALQRPLAQPAAIGQS